MTLSVGPSGRTLQQERGRFAQYGSQVSDAGRVGRRQRMQAPLITAGIALAAAGLLHTVDPGQPGHYPLCPLLALTGLYCPLCGGLRATADLSHGDIAGAFARNPIVPPLLFALVLIWGRWLWACWHDRPWTLRVDRRITLTLLGLLVAFAVARNVPGWTWLSPA